MGVIQTQDKDMGIFYNYQLPKHPGSVPGDYHECHCNKQATLSNQNYFVKCEYPYGIPPHVYFFFVITLL